MPTPLEVTIKEAAADMLAWLAVEEATVRVERASSLNDERQYFEVTIAMTDANLLIGKHGDTMAAFQHMLRQIVSQRTAGDAEAETNYTITVDVDGYRARKMEDTVEKALRSAESVRTSGNPVQLPPMEPYLRRAVHLAIADEFEDLTTESSGYGRTKVLTIRAK